MANPLTGDYEAVVQIAIRQINGLLATLHQNGAVEDAPLQLLHSTTARVGDEPRARPDLDDFRDWVFEFQAAGPPRGLHAIHGQLTSSSPPGLVNRLSEAIADLGDLVFEIPPEVVRGLVKLQIASATLSVPNGSTTQVTVHAHARAHYYPDQGTDDLPAPVHGEVRAVFDIRRVQTPTGRRLIIQPTLLDSGIQFIAAPGSGLSAADESRISAQVRKVVRHGIELLPVDLPSTFPFSDFKELGSGAAQVLALPIQLSGAPLPSALHTLTQAVVGSSGFAFAVSEEHVKSLIDLEAIREAITRRRIRIRVSVGFASRTATYRLRFSEGPALDFKSGRIEISGRVEVETSSWWAPNGFIRFKQGITLELDVANQRVDLERLGEPEVDDSLFIPHDLAVTEVTRQVDSALSSNGPTVRRVFSDAKTSLLNGVRTFDAFASVAYSGVEITADGIIVRGDISSLGRRPPIVEVKETHNHTAFTAFTSWIPGGRINRFVWSWVEYSSHLPSPWAGVEKSFTDEHRFIFPKPAGITDLSRICLRIEGSQLGPDGRALFIGGGATCEVPEPVIAIEAPSWFEPVTLPVWTTDVAADVIMSEAIAAHMSVQTGRPLGNELGNNGLVYFADWRSEKPLAALGAALAQVRNAQDLDVVVVVPAGAFEARRREFEARLGSGVERFTARLHVTEDDEGGWTRTFGVTKTPSVYLVNARRQFVWHHEGDPPAGVLADALAKYMVPTKGRRHRRVQLTLSPGDRARDIVFQDVLGNGGALHRLRGRNVLLNFWQSWSAPCLTELRRLQDLHDGSKEPPFIVAFHGGKDVKGLDEIAKRLGGAVSVVADPEHRVARRFGVRCWPTTIALGPDGVVDHVQFGVAHEHGRAKYAE